VVKQTLAIVALVILLRLPFLNQPIQGDDVNYLYGAPARADRSVASS
jgi:hypothetical protein